MSLYLIDYDANKYQVVDESLLPQIERLKKFDFNVATTKVQPHARYKEDATLMDRLIEKLNLGLIGLELNERVAQLTLMGKAGVFLYKNGLEYDLEATDELDYKNLQTQQQQKNRAVLGLYEQPRESIQKGLEYKLAQLFNQLSQNDNQPEVTSENAMMFLVDFDLKNYTIVNNNIKSMIDNFVDQEMNVGLFQSLPNLNFKKNANLLMCLHVKEAIWPTFRKIGETVAALLSENKKGIYLYRTIDLHSGYFLGTTNELDRATLLSQKIKDRIIVERIFPLPNEHIVETIRQGFISLYAEERDRIDRYVKDSE